MCEWMGGWKCGWMDGRSLDRLYSVETNLHRCHEIVIRSTAFSSSFFFPCSSFSCCWSLGVVVSISIVFRSLNNKIHSFVSLTNEQSFISGWNQEVKERVKENGRFINPGTKEGGKRADWGNGMISGGHRAVSALRIEEGRRQIRRGKRSRQWLVSRVAEEMRKK